jgi:hypothetical protein
MLDHLRQKVSELISSVSTVMISTYGPAGIQAGNFSCSAAGLRLYLLVPRTSELLFNIENRPEVIATTSEWQLFGAASVVPPEPSTGEPAVFSLSKQPEWDWCEVVEIRPTRLQVHPLDPDLPRETIDIQEINQK